MQQATKWLDQQEACQLLNISKRTLQTSMNVQETIYTKRLYLAALTVEDHHFILELLNSNGWLKYMGDRKVNSKEGAKDYIKTICDNPNITYWIVRRIDSHVPIGIITYIKRDYLSAHDLGFAFLETYTGAGYAYEAAKAIMETVNKELLFAVVLPWNIFSIRLLEKLRFKFNSEITVNERISPIYLFTKQYASSN